MFWHVVLTVLGIIFTLVTLAAIFATVVSDEPGFFLIALVVGAITAGCFIGATEIEKANTTIHTEIVEMEVGESYMADVKMASGMVETNCYIEVGNKYIIEVPFKEFPILKEKDTVLVEVETKTTFGDTTEAVRLFEGN